MKLYGYIKCDSCRKAIKWLDAKNISYESIQIRETPPSIDELKQMLESLGSLKKLFNVSGMDYRSMGMKDKLPTISEDEALELLASNGNLIKRPFVVGSKVATVGFKEAVWEELFNA